MWGSELGRVFRKNPECEMLFGGGGSPPCSRGGRGIYWFGCNFVAEPKGCGGSAVEARTGNYIYIAKGRSGSNVQRSFGVQLPPPLPDVLISEGKKKKKKNSRDFHDPFPLRLCESSVL